MARKAAGRKPRTVKSAGGVPAALRERNPLITPRAAKLLHDMKEHPDVPKWNYTCGDRITKDDFEAVAAFREELFAERGPRRPGAPPLEIVRRIASQAPHSEWLRKRIGSGVDLVRDWDALPCMTREDFSRDMGYVMPDGCDLDNMYVYDTSGTTGHVLFVPNSPRAVSSYLPLLEFAMARHGVRVKFSEEKAGCILVCAQSRTIAYASVHAVWNNSGYAKVNLKPSEWPKADSAKRYFKDFNPPVVCGDPIAFVEMMRQGIPAKPKAMISTAVALTPETRKRVEKHFKCPVIDTYSLNETGLISYACPKGFHHVLPHDLHVETVGLDGRAVKPGERGEIAVSGGRNPFVPLLRYRTGDWARMEYKACACGDAMPRLLELEGRAPVIFRAADGSAVNNVDLSKVLRTYPVVQFRFEQKKDGACELRVRPIPGSPDDWTARAKRELAELFGGRPLSVRIDEKLGENAKGGKVVPYVSAFTLET
jgi:phenylacetate-CoA ligase